MTIDPAAIQLGLEMLVLGDLHDPGDGEAEILPDSTTPRDRHLLGALDAHNWARVGARRVGKISFINDAE